MAVMLLPSPNIFALQADQLPQVLSLVMKRLLDISALGSYRVEAVGRLPADINVTKEFCQVKKNQKIREKLGSARYHPPTSISNLYFFFGNI